MNNVVSQIKDQWVILAFITSMIIWYANTNSRLTSVEADVVKQETIMEQISRLNTDVAVIKANVEFIKQQVK